MHNPVQGSLFHRSPGKCPCHRLSAPSPLRPHQASSPAQLSPPSSGTGSSICPTMQHCNHDFLLRISRLSFPYIFTCCYHSVCWTDTFMGHQTSRTQAPASLALPEVPAWRELTRTKSLLLALSSTQASSVPSGADFYHFPLSVCLSIPVLASILWLQVIKTRQRLLGLCSSPDGGPEPPTNPHLQQMLDTLGSTSFLRKPYVLALNPLHYRSHYLHRHNYEFRKLHPVGRLHGLVG